VLGHDLDRAVVRHVHDVTAHRLPVGEIDKDVIARLPAEPGSTVAINGEGGS
jgi:hypothetical protein